MVQNYDSQRLFFHIQRPLPKTYSSMKSGHSMNAPWILMYYLLVCVSIFDHSTTMYYNKEANKTRQQWLKQCKKTYYKTKIPKTR